MHDIFLKIINKDIPANIIFENEYVIAFLDISPVTKGHTLVVPKKYSKNILDIENEDLVEIIKSIKYLAPIIVDSIEADGFCIKQNNGEAADQTVMHTHFHIIPRFRDDGLVAWSGNTSNPDEFIEIANKIKNNIE